AWMRIKAHQYTSCVSFFRFIDDCIQNSPMSGMYPIKSTNGKYRIGISLNIVQKYKICHYCKTVIYVFQFVCKDTKYIKLIMTQIPILCTTGCKTQISSQSLLT